jgi:hypothetical protein
LKTDALEYVDDVEIHPSIIANYIQEVGKKYSIQMVCIDSYRYSLLSDALAKVRISKEHGNLMLVKQADIIKVVPVIDHCFLHGYFHWGNNPVLRWATNNTKTIRYGRDAGADKGSFVYAKIEDVILKEADGNLKDKIWVSDNVHSLCPSSRRFKSFKLHYLDHKYNPRGIGTLKFSDNCYDVIYDGYSIIFSIMQLAVYMGFKEIYLLGTDCNYNQTKQNFIDNGTKDPNRDIMGNRLIYTHSLFREFANSHGVKVVNCTRGGMLEVYPRKKLEEVLVPRI